MQIEEAKDILANCIADYVIGDYCVGKYCPMEDECKDKDCPFQVAIDTALNYIDIMHKELDRLEGIEDNTAMLKYELEQKDKIIDLLADDLRYYEGMGQNDLFCFDTCNHCEYCDKELCKERIKEFYMKNASDNK